MSSESQGLHLEQKQRLRLSQQQLRFVRLLELNAPELDEAVERELEDNPALKPDDDATPQTAENSSLAYYNPSPLNTDSQEIVIADNSENLYDYLERQIAELPLTDEVRATAEYLIGNIDSNGYLTRSLPLILNDIAVNTGHEIPEDTAEKALSVVRKLDPPGVGALNLQDSLRLQLERLPESPVRDDALAIINDAFTEFSMKHYHRFRALLGLDEKRSREAINLILSLNPKPGAQYSSRSQDPSNIIIPDFIVENRDGELYIALNTRIPGLSVEESFTEAVDALNRNSKEKKKNKGNEFILARYNDAREFIKIFNQRQKTMMMVMTAIAEIQKEYFLTEDVANMKPMMIKDIANRTGLDMSTISRATNNKFVATGWGILPLRHFFSDSIGEGTDLITNRRIEAEIEKIIVEEDKRHPLSDDKLCQVLHEKGFDISRRTVAKYRDRKKIPVARLRKIL